MEVSGQLYAPAALPQGKSPWYPLDRRLGGPQSRYGRGGEEKNSQPSQAHSNIILTSTPNSFEWSLQFRFSDENFVRISHLAMCVTYEGVSKIFRTES
jgi:hypothetical protein